MNKEAFRRVFLFQSRRQSIEGKIIERETSKEAAAGV